MKLIITMCVLAMLAGCTVTEYDPVTGKIWRGKFLTKETLQDILVIADPNGSYIEIGSARTDNGTAMDMMKMMFQLWLAGQAPSPGGS